jgi:hypothetical protein
MALGERLIEKFAQLVVLVTVLRGRNVSSNIFPSRQNRLGHLPNLCMIPALRFRLDAGSEVDGTMLRLHSARSSMLLTLLQRPRHGFLQILSDFDAHKVSPAKGNAQKKDRKRYNVYSARWKPVPPGGGTKRKDEIPC